MSPSRPFVSRLSGKGVRFTGSIVQEMSGKFIHGEDPDGNEVYF